MVRTVLWSSMDFITNCHLSFTGSFIRGPRTYTGLGSKLGNLFLYIVFTTLQQMLNCCIICALRAVEIYNGLSRVSSL